jgi:hypothetical protein
VISPRSASRRPVARTSLAVVAVGIGIVLGALIIEGASRFLEREQPNLADGLAFTLQPYIMFSDSGRARNFSWRNQATNTDIPSQLRLNNLGFSETRDFTFPVDDAFVREFGKKPGEKLVLMTGASVVHGVGATSNANTIAGQLQRALNEKQSQQRYRVINLAMGGWNAYQEFIGLSIFGAPLRPDWVVSMDGTLDASTVCSQGNGPGNPLQWPTMLYLTGGGQRTSYQGRVLQWLVEHSAAARLVTGQAKPAPNNQVGDIFIDEDEPDPRFRMKLRGLTVASLDRQVDFYLQAHRNMVDLFDSANVLLGTAPLLHNNAVTNTYRPAFDPSQSPAEAESDKHRLAAELDAYMAKARDTKCDSRVDSPTLGYFMARSALRLEQSVADWSVHPSSRKVLYTNVEELFPNLYGVRLPYFIDNAHLSDLGHRRIAEFFADQILQTDLGLPFDPLRSRKSVLADTTKLRAASPVSANDQPPAAPGKPVGVSSRPGGLVVTPLKAEALRIEEGPGTGLHQVEWSGIEVNAKEDSVITIDARFNQVDVVRLKVGDASGSNGWCNVDLGAKSFSDGGSVEYASVQDLGNGWRRLSVTARFEAKAASFAFRLMSPDGAQSEYPGAGRSMVITLPVVAPADAKTGGR